MAFESDLMNRLGTLEIRESSLDAYYQATYPLFIDFFDERIVVATRTQSDAKIGVTLVYSWMGRAKLDVHALNHWEAALPAISALIADNDVKENEIETLKNFVGRSVIATSKFLHFLIPARYAIWDSNVAFAGYRYAYHYQYNTVDSYIQYMRDLHNLTLPVIVRERVAKILGDVPEPRMKEFALFHLGIQELQGRRTD